MGRLTLVLYNSYDPTAFREAHRRALARAGALCAAFGANLATLGLPLPDGVRTPVELADAVTASTTIGEEGRYFRELAKGGRFARFDFPRGGLPPQLGTTVLATSKPDPAKAVSRFAVRSWLSRGRSVALVVGLGPHGVPKDVARLAEHHLDFSAEMGGGRDGEGGPPGGFSLETATAMGAGLALLLAPDEPRPRLTADGIVERGDSVLLVRRRWPPFAGSLALPGGFVEADETAAEAVVREVREETGLETAVRALVGFYSDPARDPGRHTCTAVFALQERDPARAPKGGDDAAEAAFVPMAGVTRLAFDHSRILADYREWKKDARARLD